MATMTIVSSSCVCVCVGDFDRIGKVGAEVNCQADSRLEESRAVLAKDGGIFRGLGAIFPCLAMPACAALLHKFCWLQVSLRPCRLRPPTHICPICSSFPRVLVDGKCLEGGLLLSLKCFFGAPRELFSSCSSPNSSFLVSRWSGILIIVSCPAEL